MEMSLSIDFYPNDVYLKRSTFFWIQWEWNEIHNIKKSKTWDTWALSQITQLTFRFKLWENRASYRKVDKNSLHPLLWRVYLDVFITQLIGFLNQVQGTLSVASHYRLFSNLRLNADYLPFGTWSCLLWNLVNKYDFYFT